VARRASFAARLDNALQLLSGGSPAPLKTALVGVVLFGLFGTGRHASPTHSGGSSGGGKPPPTRAS
jgi:hypothetical protein